MFFNGAKFITYCIFQFYILIEIESKSVSNTKKNEVQKLSLEMASYMDSSINPCDDFYEYACGNWEAVKGHADYPAIFVNFFMKFTDQIYENIEYMLQPPLEGEFSTVLQKSTQYYKSCMGTDVFAKKPIPEFTEYLNTIGGFPAVESNWSAKNYSPMLMQAHLFKSNTHGLFETTNHGGYPFYLIMKPISGFGLDDSIDINDLQSKNTSAFKKNILLMKYFLELYGISSENQQNIIDDIINLGEKLLKALELAKKGSPSGIPMILESLLDSDNPEENDRYMEIVLDDKNYNKSLPLMIYGLSYFEEIDKIVKEVKAETFANYLSLKFLYQMHSELRAPKYQKKFCLENVVNTFSFAIAQPYLHYYLNKNVRSDLQQMFENMQESMIKLINASDSFVDKSEYILKIQKMKAYMGFVDDDPIINNLIDIINKINVTDNFYENVINGMLTTHHVNIYHYVSRADRHATPRNALNSLTINSSYYTGKNTIQMYAALFNGPMYNEHYPKAVNYGGIGNVIGHEMSHSFDPDSFEYDSSGDKRSWLNISSKEAYLATANCLNQHVETYKFPEINVEIKGKTSLDENLPDNLGIKLSFSAYQIAKTKQNFDQNNEVLPNIAMTPNQLFFLSHAHRFCSTYYRKNVLEDIDDIHGSNKLRVNIRLQNFEEFSKAFSCPIGTKMNPVSKCKII